MSNTGKKEYIKIRWKDIVVLSKSMSKGTRNEDRDVGRRQCNSNQQIRKEMEEDRKQERTHSIKKKKHEGKEKIQTII